MKSKYYAADRRYGASSSRGKPNDQMPAGRMRDVDRPRGRLGSDRFATSMRKNRGSRDEDAEAIAAHARLRFALLIVAWTMTAAGLAGAYGNIGYWGDGVESFD